MKKEIIVEKKLGISPDYQYKAIRSKNFLQANWHNNKLIIIDEILKLTKPNNILDLGTGSGNFELNYAKKLKAITGLDYNDQALRFLKTKLKQKRIKNVKLINADLREISKIKIKEKFDLIISIDVIEHLKITDAKKLVAGLHKFLKPNGFVCIITPNYKSPWLLIENILDKFTIFPHFDGEQHLAKFCKENLQNIFMIQRFEPILFSSFNLFSFLFFNKKLSAILCRLEMMLKLPFGNLIVGLFQN
ncbi:MAG TPA: class I SAM-dependent methyltransferase [Patescibacteria group bacterium]|nr:class I SAM-dependent methyltransferase [Patescibacteria group bacterium]